MEWGIDEGIVTRWRSSDVRSAESSFWRLREEQPEGQRRLGAQLKHDLSVPPGELVDFLDRAKYRVQ